MLLKRSTELINKNGENNMKKIENSTDEVKLQIKVDWLSFTLLPQVDIKNGQRFQMLKYLGYKKEDFEKISGRFFYNSGKTLGRYLNVYYDDYSKEISKYSAKNILYVWTGQGSTDLAKRIEKKYGLGWEQSWFKFFEYLQKLGAKVTRIDLAVDCYHKELDLSHLEKRLRTGSFKSLKRRWNVIKQRDTEGNIRAYTLYVGQSRGKTSQKGGSFVRFYDKYAESKAKAVVMPREVEDVINGGGSRSWIRAEQQFNKGKAQECVNEILRRRSFGEVYYGTLRSTVEILQPSRKNKDKKTWKLDPMWAKFLRDTRKITLSDPERNLAIGRLLRWIAVAVIPSLKLIDILGTARGFNIYQLIREHKIGGFQKKQKRLLEDALQMPDELLKFYLQQFMKEGCGEKDE